MPKPKPNFAVDDDKQHKEPFLFKVIQHRQSLHSSWPEFLRSLIDQKHYELRKPNRGRYTSRLEVDESGEAKYKTISTNKMDPERTPRFTPEIKKTTTPSQSTTYRNPEKFTVKPFAEEVGIAFPLECTHPTLILKNDINTTERPFDTSSVYDQENKIAELKPYTSLSALESEYTNPRHKYDYNEVLARLRWDETKEGCRIMIFKDDPSLRLVAQARALDIYYAVYNKHKAENKDTSNLRIPQIIFYDSLKLYKNSDQQNDLNNNYTDPGLGPLAKAINALKTGEVLALEIVSKATKDLSRFSIHFNQALVNDYLNQLPTMDFLEIKDADINGWLWVIRTQILLDDAKILSTHPNVLKFITDDPIRLIKFIEYLPADKRLDFIMRDDIRIHLPKTFDKGDDAHDIQAILRRMVKSGRDVEIMLLELSPKDQEKYIKLIKNDYFGKVKDESLDNYIKKDRYDAVQVNGNLADVLNSSKHLSKGEGSYNFIVYQMINHVGFKEEIVNNIDNMVLALNYISEGERWNFITLPFVSRNLGTIIKNCDDLGKILSALPKDKRHAFIHQQNIAVLLNKPGFISTAKDLETILKNTDSKFLCDLILKDKNVFQLYQSLVKKGQHLDILRKLNVDPDSLNENEKLVLKITLFTQIHEQRNQNSGSSSAVVSQNEQQLVQKFINNELSFKDLLTEHKKEKSNSTSTLFKSWSTESKSKQKENVLDIIATKSQFKY